MSRRLIAAKQFSTSQENKIVPEGKRKNNIGIILASLADNTPHIDDSDFYKKYSKLPKIGDDIKTSLKEHEEKRKKYDELSKIFENYHNYDNGINAHLAEIELKDSENKLGISSETKYQCKKGGKSIKNKKNSNKKSEKVGKKKNKNKNKNTIRLRKHRSTQFRK